MDALVDWLLNAPAPSPYWGPVLLCGFGLIVGVGSIVVGSVVRPKNPSDVKLQPYECGMDPVGDAQERIPIRYYTVAMLFLLFDAEAIFLWPWAVAYKQEGTLFLIEALTFIILVGFGYVYAWNRGAFEWKKR